MKKFFMLSVLSTAMLVQSASAREWVSKVRKYIHKDTNQIIELGGWDLSEDGKTNKHSNYKTGKREVVQMEDYVIDTYGEIAGVSPGEYILVDTLVGNSKTETINRFCQVYNLFENKKAYVGCRTYEADRIPGYRLPERLDYIIHNVEQVVAQVESVDGIQKGTIAELAVETETIKLGKNVRVLAVFANGEALVERAGFGFLDTSSIVYKGNVEKVKVSDLRN